MRVLLPFALVLASGCSAPAYVIYDGSKNEASRLIARIMAEKRPTLDPQAATACVIAGMSYPEVIALGTSDISVTTAKHRAKVDEVLAREKVGACLDALAPKAA
jgi:hypothetical protein